jgi:hypothetical protein
MKEAAMSRTSRRIRNNKAVKKPVAAGKENIAQGAVAAAEKAKEPATCEPGSWAKKLASSIAQPQPQQEQQETASRRRKPSPESEVDAISEMSTASTAAPETPSSACEKRQEEATWTSILAKKRTKPRVAMDSDAAPSPSSSDSQSKTPLASGHQGSASASISTGGQSQEGQQSHSGDSHRDDYSNRYALSQRQSGYSNYSSYSGYSGYSASPKGLPHFRKIEVGIEDDSDFRVVQRLIGPRGKYVQDITEKCRGSKVWIIGKGSRSWEDSAGPLVVCVGATTGNEFENAVGLINELLERVRKEHRRFRRGAF